MGLIPQPLAGSSTETAPDLSSKPEQERLSHSAIPAVFRLIEAWQVRDEALWQHLEVFPTAFISY